MLSDFNFWIGISGLLFTLIFGFLSIYLVKRKRYPGSITFFEEKATGLFNSLVKNFSQIKVTYADQNITQQIALVKGYLFNDGSIDIKESMIEQQLSLNLPENFKWLSATITTKTEGSKSTLEIINNSTILFQLHLFRRKEFLNFEALAEIPIHKSDLDTGEILSKNISFKHRISDTAQVKKLSLNLELLKIWSLKSIKRLVLPITAILYIILSVIFIRLIDDARALFFSIPDKSSHIIKTFITPHSDNTIDLSGTNGDVYRKVDLKTLNQLPIKSISVGKVEYRSFVFVHLHAIILSLVTFLFVVSMIPFLSILWDYRKIKNLRETFNRTD